MKAFGSTIDCLMNAASLSASDVLRFGPTAPVAPASLSVWQALHPFALNTAMPAVASPVGAGLVVVCVVLVVDEDVLSAAFDSPANRSTAASWAITSSATAPMKTPIRLPGKFGLLRGKTNEQSSAKMMKIPATTPRPIVCAVESASGTGAEPTRAIGPVASG